VPAIKKGIAKKKKWTLGYANISSAIRPVPHCEGLPIPKPPTVFPRLELGRKEYTRRNTIVIYFKRSGTFPERNL
jgi:hypothetical protein